MPLLRIVTTIPLSARLAHLADPRAIWYQSIPYTPLVWGGGTILANSPLAMPKKGVARRQNLDSNGIRRLGSKKSGFQFVTAGGRRIAEARTLERIQKLRIPPAWENVRIARGEAAPLQAVGIDKKGRTQYLYHSKFRQQKEEEKFLRVVEFGESLPQLRQRILHDLGGSELDRTRVMAAIVRLIDQGFFRVGNDKSAKSESTYGLTTVLSEHVSVQGAAISFDYVGKWKKTQQQTIRDRDVAGIIRNLFEVEGDELFKFIQNGTVHDVKDRHVNDYIQSIIGDRYTAKDFRTWAGTLLCAMALGFEGPASTKTATRRAIRKAIDETARSLGNTPAVCRKSYICPRVLEEYEEGRTMEITRKQRKKRPVALRGLSLEERSLLKLLRETIANRRLRPHRVKRGGIRAADSGGKRRTAPARNAPLVSPTQFQNVSPIQNVV